MHAGPNHLLSSIRETYWPIRGRNLARSTVHKCARCHRFKAQPVTPLMGQLPRDRVVPGFPFETTGIDYAGPIYVASKKGRGAKLSKAYLAVFVCFTTKAIHLEPVTDLTTECFLMALRRFISRRGKPINIYSDNGLNFVGACNELKRFFRNQTTINTVADAMTSEDITFHFAPAYAPHFGGLYESAVKSAKHHLKRIAFRSHLTFEELCTLLTQIEAILNSRPLSPLSSDPNDLNPLTPGHFLIGRSFTTIPSHSYHQYNINRLTRYERIEALRQHFWKRWHAEYLRQLQQRNKWMTNNTQLNTDKLVLLKDENLPPLKWKLGRITKLYPGQDGIARVADVRTIDGIVRRAACKICPLPDSE
ncbi:hypothetical protein ABMA28_000653 [Loxostege sticticalis]|uniref:Integrase catalytic domain-containing protein n=1 Tax=Loxostege sticticalis TaxID=481309 RepID=A0ABD0T335_LOXSC